MLGKITPQQTVLFLFTGIAIVLLFIFRQLTFIPTFLLIYIQCVLGLAIYLRDKKSEINVSYAAFVILFALWNFCAFLVTNRSTPGLIWADQFIFIPAAFLLAFFLYFTFVFPRQKKSFNIKHRVSIFLPPILLSILVPFDLIIKDLIIKDGVVTPVFGTAYPLYIIFAVIYIFYGLYNLIKHYITSFGIDKLQIGYVLLGLFLSLGSLSLSNLILPWLSEARLAPFGPFFTLFFVAFTAYAILKHRLLSIEIVIQKGTVYALATIVILAFYALAVIISELYFRKILGYTSLAITAIAALIIAVVYQPLIKIFQNIADKLFFPGRYDYQKTLREVGHKIASVIKFEDLTRLIVSTFTGAMKVSEVSLLILDKEKKRYRSVPIELSHGQSRYKRIEIDEASSIAVWLKMAKDILFLDEINNEISKRGLQAKEGNKYSSLLLDVKEEIENLGVALWVPIVSKDELVGIISLGQKLSSDIFTSEDLALLTTLANQAAVALDNARLYEEVLTMKNYTQDVLNTMVSGVVTIDMRGEIVTFNPMAEKITGLPTDNVIGRNFKEVLSDKNAIYQIFDRALHNRCHNNFEASVVSQKRGLVPVSLNTSILKDSYGRKSGVLLSISDLTEVKALEGKVREADKINALGTMAAGMAHEIKNPLSSMKVLSQLLPLKYNDQEFRSKFIEIMPREITRIDRIVESLLGFARATSPKFVPININKMLEDDIIYFDNQAQKARVKIKTELASLPEIEGDPDQLSQVFSNLILNAIQAMPEGGEISIKSREGKKIEDVLQTVEVEIKDTGHGIAPDNLKRLFDPFFTTKHAGTGLGLTISHSIIDSHGGTIDVRSEIGRGTTFTVALPVKQELV